MRTAAYAAVVAAGAEGLITYQETYHQPTYEALHTAGPKRRFDFRLDTVERGYEAGFRQLGIGALFGLHDWRFEAVHLAAHALYLTRRCWKAQLSLSFPRMRPAHGDFTVAPAHDLSDRNLLRLILATRLLLPHAGITLSTRESPRFRDGITPLGITRMSAGSSTEPGGYSDYDSKTWKQQRPQEGEQFAIADDRSPAEIAAMIRRHNLDPVWKDFDASLVRDLPVPWPAAV